MQRRQYEDPAGPWNEELFRVLEGFPDPAHDDEVDALRGSFRNAQSAKGWLGLVGTR
jgi:phage terminase large subunit-like protein